jgi:uncharacterized protein YeaO (DUF488 family)
LLRARLHREGVEVMKTDNGCGSAGPHGPSRVHVARAYEPRGTDGAARVLVDRLWPRGLTKEQADLDVWRKDIAPSTDLRRWYHHGEQYEEFRQRYIAELSEPPRSIALVELAALAEERGLVLLTATRNIAISHVTVLAEVLLANH